MSKNICPICNKQFIRVMRHIRDIHPDLYKEECAIVVTLFKAGKTLREIGKDPSTHWSFGRALSTILKEHFSDAALRAEKNKRISATLLSGYSDKKYSLIGRGRKKKATR